MNVYIWTDLAQVSDNYHAGGGLVIVAKTLDAAKRLVGGPAYPDVVIDQVPDRIIRGVPDFVTPGVIVMACKDPWYPRDGDPI